MLRLCISFRLNKWKQEESKIPKTKQKRTNNNSWECGSRLYFSLFSIKKMRFVCLFYFPFLLSSSFTNFISFIIMVQLFAMVLFAILQHFINCSLSQNTGCVFEKEKKLIAKQVYYICMNVCVWCLFFCFFFIEFVHSPRSEYERQKKLTATKKIQTWTTTATMKTTMTWFFPLSRL